MLDDKSLNKVAKVSERIRLRLQAQGVSFFANDNVSNCIEPGELAEL